MELSRLTKYLLDRGAVLTVKFTSTHYRRSFQVQGGIKIPSMTKAKTIATEKNKRILVHYLDFVKCNYEDISPEREIIVGYFLASEESKKTEANNSVKFSVDKRTDQKKKTEIISQDNSTDI